MHGFPEARFVIVGDGSLENDLKELSKRLRVQEYVRFVGFIPHLEIPKLMNLADVYVSTSLSDTFSVSTIEAMACSKPVVIADIPGTEEWVKPGRNGYLFPKRNYHALAERIKCLLDDSQLAKEIGRNNREVAEARADFSISMKQIYDIYLQLVEIKRMRREFAQ